MLIVGISLASVSAQIDPGPRGGPANAGAAYASLSAEEQQFFAGAMEDFSEVDSVSGALAGESDTGLGPAFNGNSCTMCHLQPAIGGSSPGLTSKQNPTPNPQVAMATLDGATNTVPSFITIDGPVREARFIRNANHGGLDGGVHALYTVRGRSDAPGCNLAQPDFASELAANNVSFRIPTPLFGLGFVEATPDAALQTNLSANRAAKALLGIAGKLNTSGNDGTVTRFGWKAQNKSLVIFSGEAYNVEQGVSNEVFPNERSAVAGCVFNPSPEDASNITNKDDHSTAGTVAAMSSGVVNFAAFARLSAPPAATTASASELSGQALFGSVGCAACHTDSLTTGPSRYAGMSNAVYHPYSDFAVHHMGAGLADGVNQGAAGPDEFRTAPLWGVGQRLFFLHDGRAVDLLQAITAHKSPRSEASAVTSGFNGLSAAQKQDILNFLRSL